MIANLTSLVQCRRASTAAEFGLVLPLLLILLFGVIDGGRLMWEVNKAEKATEMGARFAAVTTPVSPGIVTADFVGGDIGSGDLIPADALGGLSCTKSACTCSGTCPVTDLSVDEDAFDALVTRMQSVRPDITEDNVTVTYRGSGFGFAGGEAPPGGTEPMEISPLITVSLTGLQFRPLTALLLATLDLPSFSTTLPAEDASGAYSN
jgi:hypothetical protein